MLKRLLRNLRQKPKSVRDHIALASAGVFTALVASIWMYHFPSKLDSFADSGTTKEEGSAFSSFFGDMKEQLAALQESNTPTATSTSPSLDESAGGSSTASSVMKDISSSSAATNSAGSATATSEGAETPTAPTSSTSPTRPIRIVTTPTSSSTASSSTVSESQ